MSSPTEHPEPTPNPPASTDPPPPVEPSPTAPREKPKVSPARNAVALVLLVVLLTIGGLELSALFQFNSAVGRLDEALESNEADLIARAQVEEILGKEADSPLVEDRTGMLTTYTWRGALRSHVLSAYYSYGDDPGLMRYEIGAPQVSEAAAPAAEDPRMVSESADAGE